MDTFQLTGNETENKTTLSFQTYALQVLDVDSDQFKEQTFTVDLGSVEEALAIDGRINSNKLTTAESVMEVFANATASILLPGNVFNGSAMRHTQRLSYSVFLTDILFQVSNSSEFVVGSIIVGVRLESLNAAVLSTPLQTRFRINQEVNKIRFNIAWHASCNKDFDFIRWLVMQVAAVVCHGPIVRKSIKCFSVMHIILMAAGY